MRFFNTAGPIDTIRHYCLPPLHRFDLDEVMILIQQQKYFVLHAPRQTGKTSYLLALMTYLNSTGDYHCLYINLEAAQAIREDISKAMQIIYNQLAVGADTLLGDSYLKQEHDKLLKQAPYNVLDVALTLWAEQSSKPLILLIDEIDALIGDTLISVLRQLRSGYHKRPKLFPQSVVLCGVRDVRDYRIHSNQSKEIITGGSAFNIKATSLRLGNFSQAEVETLYRQHTAETGQVFTPETLQLVWQLTAGQPWLVNALAYEVTYTLKAGRDHTKPITAEMILIAKENLIQRRETHLDQLTDKLQEARVRRVIEPILNGDGTPESIPADDIDYVYDLGLIKIKPELTLANAIYQEIIPRQLIYTTQATISHQTAWYVGEDGQLEMTKLLTAFQQFFREHSEHWMERFDYKEAGPQLLLQAFLQRVVNGGGRIEREYGLGRGRTDLLVIWPPSQRIVLELKLLRRSLEKTMADGLAQTWAYMDRCQTEDGHLIIFDRREGPSWEEKIFQREAAYEGHKIVVWGM